MHTFKCYHLTLTLLCLNFTSGDSIALEVPLDDMCDLSKMDYFHI